MAKKSTPQKQGSSHTGGVDLEEVERLLEFMAKHGLEEFEYERAGFRIRLRKPFSQPMGFSRAVSAPEIVVAAVPSAASGHAGPAAGGGTAAPKERGGGGGRAASEDRQVGESLRLGPLSAPPPVGGEPFGKVGPRVDQV